MRLPSFALAALICFSLPGAGSAEPCLVDMSQAFVTFSVDHPGFSTGNGRFRGFDGDIDFDPSNAEVRIPIRIDIEMRSKT